MPLLRNRTTTVGKLPRINKPRTLFSPKEKNVLTSLRHGVLTPFYINIVYPYDSWKGAHSTFIRSDISTGVPLQDIYLDTFYFFVPFRILDKNFAKVLGERDDPLDNNVYTVPQITLLAGADLFASGSSGQSAPVLKSLPYYLQYNQVGNTSSSSAIKQKEDRISAYSIAAYYCIWNEFFRDENLNAKIPFEDLYNGSQSATSDLDDYRTLGLYHINKFTDWFTSGMVSAQKSPDGEPVKIPLGTTAPVISSGDLLFEGKVTGAEATLSAPSSADVALTYGDAQIFRNDGVLNVNEGLNYKSGLSVDLSEASSATIDQLRISFAIQSLYEMRGRYGTRYIETLSQWGANVPDDLVDRPIYLGGESMPLSNIPVLSTATSDLGKMSGVSATLGFNEYNKWSRSFLEYGFVIGVAATRVAHVYTQGRDPKIHDYVNDLDFYHWVYANIGYQGTINHSIYNDPADSENDEVFNFQEAFGGLRTDFDVCAGIFNPNSGPIYQEIRNKWTYADYYSSRPYFSSDWLKEDASNVARTLTGRLIPSAAFNTDYTHQFMLNFKIHVEYARVMPTFSQPANLVGRW